MIFFFASKPVTFSNTIISGLNSFTNLTNSKNRWFLESSASPGPIVENPWQGGPPQTICTFLFLIFFLKSFIEIFLISPSIPIEFLWLILNVSMAFLK